MSQIDLQLSTGLPGLDRMLKGLIPGDNIVMQIDSIEDYKFFIAPFCENARKRGRAIIYLRFAHHDPLIEEEAGAKVYKFDPEAGFESFVSNVHSVIQENGRGAFYIFDCLSDLAEHWRSDQMLGNFFMLTCPYLFDIEAIAYFSLLRGRHSSDAVFPIYETAQVSIDVFRHKGNLYLHPLKVQQRHSPTMYMLHVWSGGDFLPVTESSVISEVMTAVPRINWEFPGPALGYCNRILIEAQEVLGAIRRGERVPTAAQTHLGRLLRTFVTRDKQALELAERRLTLEDAIAIRRRMIGTGLIGGKAAGMLIARSVIMSNRKEWGDSLEPHDSFFIGSDVFYTFIVRNGIWSLRERQKNPENFLDGADEARRRMLTGRFSQATRRQFSDMLDYFGQSPIVVRSSSLLEDNYGNAFSGKYESVFCANQGSRDKRLQDFLSAVKSIYSSAMSEEALLYRSKRGLLEQDEQMALLVQRVSGSMHGQYFFPHSAGVGYSYNPYVWNSGIDPHAGMMRLVFGLGTRAVDRADDDYTRIVSLNAPEKRPEENFDKVRSYSQRKVDVIDLESNQIISAYFSDLIEKCSDIPLDLFVSEDPEAEKAAWGGTRHRRASVITFDKLLKKTSFVKDVRSMLSAIQDAYGCSVDVEFACNFLADGSYKIHLLQCRPLQMIEPHRISAPPDRLSENDLIFEAREAIIGKCRAVDIDWIVYVDPKIYGTLPMSDRYSVARTIGRLLRHEGLKEKENIMLVGPGRWGSTMPALGVPVSFAEINSASVICEIVAMNEFLAPDVSLGTHFFNDLVEADILYLALFPEKNGNLLNEAFFSGAPNRIFEFLSIEDRLSKALRVIGKNGFRGGKMLKLNANTVNQKAVCYLGAGTTEKKRAAKAEGD